MVTAEILIIFFMFVQIIISIKTGTSPKLIIIKRIIFKIEGDSSLHFVSLRMTDTYVFQSEAKNLIILVVHY